jgi:hypothetical protein
MFSIVLFAALGGVTCRAARATPFEERRIVVIEHKGQTERAKPTTMPWCQGKFTDEMPTNDGVKRAILNDPTQPYRLAEAAALLCAHKEDPTWIKQATYVVQAWMNINEQTQAEAEAAIIARVAKDKSDKENASKPETDEHRHAFSEQDLVEVKPNDGIAQAKITDKPAWCDKAGKIDEQWTTNRIAAVTTDKYIGVDGKVQGALHVCQRPTDATWKTYAGFILQRFMNTTRLSQPDAERALRSRIQTAKFSAERTELCKALEFSPELGGGEKAYAQARRVLFGCGANGRTLWQDPSQLNPRAIGFYLDPETQPDELMRLAFLFAYVPDPSSDLPADSARDNLPLLYYAIAQTDFANLDTTAIDKTLSAAPYNDYARTVMLESVATIKAEQRVYEKAIDKLAKGDADYTAILRTAPKQAFADWDKMVQLWKPELDRSNAFEKLLSQPSRKVLKGCSVELHKDGEKVVKSYKTTVYKDLVDKISADPVANLVLSRIALCYAADELWGASGALSEIVTNGRDLRGPRSLAYYAVVQAIVDAKKDRPRLLVDLSNFFRAGSALSGDFEAPGKDLALSGTAPREWEQSKSKGVVASTKKVEDGLQVVFKKVTLKIPDYECADDTRHPLRINSDGRVEYYRTCKSPGTFTKQDATPYSIVIAPSLAEGVKPGSFLQFSGISKTAKNGDPFAVIVWTKKKPDDKTINSFFGFAL